MKLATYRQAWPLDTVICPCDAELVEVLEIMEIRGKTLFHFGTGSHHLVGRSLPRPTSPNKVLAVTANREEYDAYIDIVMEDAEIAKLYKVMFCDIYTLSGDILPVFDFVTLFHLCEFYRPERHSYAPLDDEALLALMIERTAPGGILAFYTGSCAFSRARPLIEDVARRGLIRKLSQYKHLDLYTKV
jgi:SAM-dependent methyltransferase